MCKKKVGQVRRDMGAIWYVLTPFNQFRSSPPQNEPFSQEKQLKLLHLSVGLKIKMVKS